MKTPLLLLFLFVSGLAFGQCQPDTTISSPGIYPDSATNFVISYVGQPYEQIVTAVVPQDTCVVIINPPCQTVTIDSILVTSVTGLPPNFTYECDQPNCAFYGGSSGCLKVYSTSNPVAADTGTYNLQFTLVTYSIIQQTNTVDYYTIHIVDTTTVGIKENVVNYFELGQNSPNPATGLTNIGFTSSVYTNMTFHVVNMLGEVVHEEKILAKSGQNNIAFNAQELKPGVYFYVLDDGLNRRSRRMLVR